MKVKALDTYEKHNIKDSELRRIPKKGECFTVSSERAKILLGQNTYGLVFVEEIPNNKKTKEKEVSDKDDSTENI